MKNFFLRIKLKRKTQIRETKNILNYFANDVMDTKRASGPTSEIYIVRSPQLGFFGILKSRLKNSLCLNECSIVITQNHTPTSKHWPSLAHSMKPGWGGSQFVVCGNARCMCVEFVLLDECISIYWSIASLCRNRYMWRRINFIPNFTV